MKNLFYIACITATTSLHLSAGFIPPTAQPTPGILTPSPIMQPQPAVSIVQPNTMQLAAASFSPANTQTATPAQPHSKILPVVIPIENTSKPNYPANLTGFTVLYSKPNSSTLKTSSQPSLEHPIPIPNISQSTKKTLKKKYLGFDLQLNYEGGDFQGLHEIFINGQKISLAPYKKDQHSYDHWSSALGIIYITSKDGRNWQLDIKAINSPPATQESTNSTTTQATSTEPAANEAVLTSLATRKKTINRKQANRQKRIIKNNE